MKVARLKPIWKKEDQREREREENHLVTMDEENGWGKHDI